MPHAVTINTVTIEQLLYRDTPVVTFQQIAEVHGISVKNIQESFRRHRGRFTEGKHYFRLDFAEARQLPSSVEVSPNGLTVFTEKGYLLLTKPLRDDKSWEVQERMVDEYFALQSSVIAPPYVPTVHHVQNADLTTLLCFFLLPPTEKRLYSWCG